MPFEDKDDLPEKVFHRRSGSLHEEPILIPDTLIPVDLEVEVVEISDYSYEYRKVLRIKN